MKNVVDISVKVSKAVAQLRTSVIASEASRRKQSMTYFYFRFMLSKNITKNRNDIRYLKIDLGISDAP